MLTVSQNLPESEAQRRVAWIQEHLGHRADQSGSWQMTRYQWSHRVMLHVYFNHPEDQTFYLLRWA